MFFFRRLNEKIGFESAGIESGRGEGRREKFER